MTNVTDMKLQGLNTAMLARITKSDTNLVKGLNDAQASGMSTAEMMKMQYSIQQNALVTNLSSSVTKTLYDMIKGILNKFP